MIQIHSFTFNPFQENTYVLFDETKECIIVDPGCYDDSERQQLADFITHEHLKPVKIINTHCHLDHIFGNSFFSKKYGIGVEININDLPLLNALVLMANKYELNAEDSPAPTAFLKEGDSIEFGHSKLEVIFAPGHSAGSIVLCSKEQKFMIVGDVLFYGSIGRTDLPGGDHQTLINNIKHKLLPLGDDFKVYSGHGQTTSIGFEKTHNPFLTN